MIGLLDFKGGSVTACRRIPHRRGCIETVKGFDGITGEVADMSVINYSKLEPEQSRSNASKIRYPAHLFHTGKAYIPRENSLGKIKVRPAHLPP
jgi:hypothetical protein